MKHFFDRIREKALDAAAAPVLIVALGDSVTQGAMEYGCFSPQDTYHRYLQIQLEQYYPTTTFSTLNAGVSGSNVRQVLNRLDRDVIRHQPDLVLIAFGLNDSLEGRVKLSEFENNLTQMIARIRQHTAADMILLTPPFMVSRKELSRIHPQHLDYADAIISAQTDGTLALYAERIRNAAKQNQLPLADIHHKWEHLSQTGADTNSWLANGLNHPDKRGHKIAAEIVFQAIFSNTP